MTIPTDSTDTIVIAELRSIYVTIDALYQWVKQQGRVDLQEHIAPLRDAAVTASLPPQAQR